MAGYIYGFDLRPAPGTRVEDPRIRDAFWRWTEGHFRRLAARDASFVAALRKYLGELGLPRSLSLSRRGKVLGLVLQLKDCGGMAETSMLAAMHVFDRLTVEDPSGLQSALLTAGVRPVLRRTDRSPEAARARFFTYRGRIAGYARSWLDEDLESHRGLAVTWDPTTNREPMLVPLVRFPDDERSRIEALVRERRCFCPVHAQRSPYVFAGRRLPPFKPAAGRGKGNAPWRIAVDSRILSAVRTNGNVSQVEWRTMRFLQGALLRAVRKEIRTLEAQGDNSFESSEEALQAADRLHRRAAKQVRARA